jgi:hypothetical protein
MAAKKTTGSMSPRDRLTEIEGMLAQLALQLPGQNLLSLDPMQSLDRMRSLPGIPNEVPAYAPQQELGFGPRGTIFTGGSPHEIDFTGRRVKNAAFLLDELRKSGLFDNLFKKQ